MLRPDESLLLNPFFLNSFLLLEYTDLPNIPTEQQEIYSLSDLPKYCVHHFGFAIDPRYI